MANAILPSPLLSYFILFCIIYPFFSPYDYREMSFDECLQPPSLKHPLSYGIALAAFLLVALFGASPVAIVLAAALIGFLFFGGLSRSGKEDDA